MYFSYLPSPCNELLRGRDAIYAHVTEGAFRDAFAGYFTTIAELTLANGAPCFICKRSSCGPAGKFARSCGPAMSVLEEHRHFIRANTGFRERNPLPWKFKESHAIN